MADRSKIEWTRSPDGSAGATWNPIRARNKATGKIGWHCAHASPGCVNCYAEAINKRLGTGLPFKPGHAKDIAVYLDEATLIQPLRWKRPRLIFPGSMTDLFADFVTDAMLDKIMTVAALTPRHTYQFLTKRSERMRDYMALDPLHRIHTAAAFAPEAWRWAHNPAAAVTPYNLFSRVSWPLSNVWCGASVEDQPRADERLPHLERTIAMVRWVSYEPALGPVNFSRWLPGLDGIVGGGESGREARMTPRAWLRSARDQCAAAGIPYFHKQNGEWIDADEWHDRLRNLGYQISFNGVAFDPVTPLNFEDAALLAGVAGARRPFEHFSDGSTMIRVGKKAAGRLLDGVEHNALPTA
jgi:protein gp37